MKNALVNAVNNFQSFLQKYGVAPVQRAYEDVVTDVPTAIATAQRQLGQALMPTYRVLPYDEEAKNIRMAQELATQRTPMQSLVLDPLSNKPGYLDLDPFVEKGGSAELQPMAIYPNDPRLNALKQSVLDAMNLRPAMRKYLETVPVQQGNLRNFKDEYGNPRNVAGIARESLTPQHKIETTDGITPSWETAVNVTPDHSPYIVLERRMGTDPNSPGLRQVLSHEYLHTTLRVQRAREGMAKLLQNLPEKSVVRDAALQYFMDGELPPNPEELFATLGEQFGQYALTIPEIQDYYRNIFARPTTQENPIYYSYEPSVSSPNMLTSANRQPLKVPIRHRK